MANNKKIAITGHRPDKLFGYNLAKPEYKTLSDKIKDILIKLCAGVIFDGMALGVDQIAAMTAICMRQSGYDIRIHAAIPCQNHSSKWYESSKQLYNKILSLCDEVTLVTDAPYHPSLMQKRNEFMVDNSDIVLAVFDGTRGGTYNCVKYAISCGKPVVCLPPKSGEPYLLFDGKSTPKFI